MLPLLLGVGLLLLITSKAPGGPGRVDEIFQRLRGALRYRPIPRKQIIDSLVFRALYPPAQGGPPDTAFIVTGAGRIFGPNESGAWFQLRALHDQGFDLWVRPQLHESFGEQPEPVMFLLPGAPAPPDMAMLIGADTPWPEPPPGLAHLV